MGHKITERWLQKKKKKGRALSLGPKFEFVHSRFIKISRWFSTVVDFGECEKENKCKNGIGRFEGWGLEGKGFE